LLGEACGRGEQQGKAGHPENAPCHLVHVILPKVLPAKSAMSFLILVPKNLLLPPIHDRGRVKLNTPCAFGHSPTGVKRHGRW
jgi:hypothetical protein